MIERLPYYYRKSKYIAELYTVIQKALAESTENINVSDLKLFVTTTDDFTLHERDVGLTDISADRETKRSRVLARLQGNNLLTKNELEKLIVLYEDTGCTIVEDYSQYIVRIIFSGRIGKPHNLEQIKAAVEEVKPAHIQVIYEFLKNTWNQAREKMIAWGNARAFTWDGIQEGDGKTWLYWDVTDYYTKVRTWNQAKNNITTWKKAKEHKWSNVQIRKESKIYLQKNNANAYLVFKDGEYYAHLI